MNSSQTPPPYNGNPGQPRPGFQNPPYGPQQPYGNPGGYNNPPVPPPGYYQPQQQPYQQPWQPYAHPMQPRSNGMGTAGFVLSIVGLFLRWIPFVGWLIWLLGAVFSFIGLFKTPRGLAIAGVIISLVLIPVLVTIFVALDVFTSAMFLL